MDRTSVIAGRLFKETGLVGLRTREQVADMVDQSITTLAIPSEYVTY